MIFVRKTQVHQGLQLYQVNKNLSTHYEVTSPAQCPGKQNPDTLKIVCTHQTRNIILKIVLNLNHLKI